MKTKPKTGAVPAEASKKELARMRKDGKHIGKFGLGSFGSMVWVEEDGYCACVPRRTFNALLKWYQTEQPFVRK